MPVPCFFYYWRMGEHDQDGREERQGEWDAGKPPAETSTRSPTDASSPPSLCTLHYTAVMHPPSCPPASRSRRRGTGRRRRRRCAARRARARPPWPPPPALTGAEQLLDVCRAAGKERMEKGASWPAAAAGLQAACSERGEPHPGGSNRSNSPPGAGPPATRSARAPAPWARR